MAGSRYGLPVLLPRWAAVWSLIGGSVMLRFGKPVAEATSPAYLPAYLDTQN